MPLPRSEGRGPAEAVALKFSPDSFPRDLREKDLKPIVLDVIDQAYSVRKLLFGGLGALGVLKIGQAFLKASDVGRIVGEGVIRLWHRCAQIRSSFSRCRRLRACFIDSHRTGVKKQSFCLLTAMVCEPARSECCESKTLISKRCGS